ncbi:MAG: 3-phosphoshikimate 1-carboxyvinyltransferase [Halanaerobiaceae bacterium]|nr:3-phosphoshikimate 1-carboxyvinyltransferase [Halanaerobiaceae bacterium]
MSFNTFQANSLMGEITIPGDKSISHRAVILSSIAEGKSYIKGFLESDDCLHTIKIFQALGVEIEKIEPGYYMVEGVGLNGLREASNVLYCGNSGTTARLLAGLLAAQDFYSVLTGDNFLNVRPMDRIIKPLEKMGARIWSREDKYLPLSIKGSPLKGIQYELPVASAQLKSALLLAGLYAQEELKIIEPELSRDHTERMLQGFGVDLVKEGKEITLSKKGEIKLDAQEIEVPGDLSSAAFFIAAALITPDSDIVIRNVGINPTRDGFLRIIQEMGARIEFFNIREKAGEPLADIRVMSSNLKAVSIEGELIPLLIDELPLLAVLAARAEGRTIIRDAAELRVKESDRISATVEGLRKLGVRAEEMPDGMVIEGPARLQGGVEIESYYDHRLVMSFIVAGLISREPFKIKDVEAVNVSFPDFNKILKKLCYR